MDKYQFQEGGLPLTIEYLQSLERRFEALEKMARFLNPIGSIFFPDGADGKYQGGLRLSGMELTRDEDNNTLQVSAGFVLIDAQVVEVRQSEVFSATLQDGYLWLHPHTETTSATYKDGTTKPFLTKNYFTIDNVKSANALAFNIFNLTPQQFDTSKEFRLIAKSKVESVDSSIRNLNSSQSTINSKISEIEANAITTAGSGLTKEGNSLKHSNSVTEQTDYLGSSTSVPRLKFDTNGHITAKSTSTIYPPTSAGTSGQYWKSNGSGQGSWQTLATSAASGSNVAITSDAVYKERATSNQSNYRKTFTPTVSTTAEYDYCNISSPGLYLIFFSVYYDTTSYSDSIKTFISTSSQANIAIACGISGSTCIAVYNKTTSTSERVSFSASMQKKAATLYSSVIKL